MSQKPRPLSPVEAGDVAERARARLLELLVEHEAALAFRAIRGEGAAVEAHARRALKLLAK